MPRSSSANPPYRLHKATGQALVHIGGRDVYLGPFDSAESKAKYQEIVRKHLADQVSATVERSIRFHVDLTMAELMLRYFEWAEQHYVKRGKPTSQVAIIKTTIGVVRKKFAHLEIAKFGPVALRECQQGFTDRGYPRTEVNRRVKLVRQMFSWAVGEELISESVLIRLKAVKPLLRGKTEAAERQRVRTVPDAYVDAVLPHVPPIVAAMIRVQALTGMRPDEVTKLRACDLVASGSEWEYRPAQFKTEHHEDSDRVIMIGPRAQEILKPFLSLNLTGYLFSPQRSEVERNTQRHADRKTPLYASHVAHQKQKLARRARRPIGNHYTVGTYRQAIHRACEHVGIPEWSPNQLRHSAATKLRREMGIEAASAVLGHSDTNTTTLYAERDMELARQAMARFG